MAMEYLAKYPEVINIVLNAQKEQNKQKEDKEKKDNNEQKYDKEQRENNEQEKDNEQATVEPSSPKTQHQVGLYYKNQQMQVYIFMPPLRSSLRHYVFGLSVRPYVPFS